MNIQSIFSLNALTIVFIIGCVLILAGFIAIILLALKREINSLVSISLMVIIFGLFLITVDRVLIKYVDYDWLNKIQMTGIAVFGIFYLFKNWKRK